MTDKYGKVQNFIAKDLLLYANDQFGKEYADALDSILSDDIKESLSSCRYNRDVRTIEEYAQEIIFGWVIENNMKDRLEAFGNKVELTGADKKRELLKGGKISADVDFKVNGIKVELVTDFNEYWMKKKVLHLRDRKYKKLFNEEAILLAVDIVNRTYQIIHVPSVEAKEVMHYVWRKSAFEIKINPNEFLSIDEPIKIPVYS